LANFGHDLVLCVFFQKQKLAGDYR